MLDALVEASAELKKKEAERTAVVAVSAIGVEFSSRNRSRPPLQNLLIQGATLLAQRGGTATFSTLEGETF